MGQTITQKIIARASGRSEAHIDEIVWAKVDLAMMHDSSGPRRIDKDLQRLGGKVWDPDRIVIVTDHFTPASGEVEALIQQITRKWAKKYGIKKFHEAEGICHIVPSERGYIIPGMLMTGADSHTPTAGAMGALAIPLGSTEMLGVVVTGEVWLRVPQSIRIIWEGELPFGVMAKDMVLANLKELTCDGANYQVVEFMGSTVEKLSMEERMVLTNMTTEMGAKTGIIAPDETTFVYLRERTSSSYEPLYSDHDATYARTIHADASKLEPMVARPPSPDNVVPVREVGEIPISQAYIGACTGAKYTDMVQAARAVEGRKVAPGVRFLVAPASREMQRRAMREGILEILLEAGATLLPIGCGACGGFSNGVLGPEDVCISSTNRNFPGRMGNVEAQVYLASPATVAASAIAGKIVDPRPYLRGEV